MGIEKITQGKITNQDEKEFNRIVTHDLEDFKSKEMREILVKIGEMGEAPKNQGFVIFVINEKNTNTICRMNVNVQQEMNLAKALSTMQKRISEHIMSKIRGDDDDEKNN